MDLTVCVLLIYIEGKSYHSFPREVMPLTTVELSVLYNVDNF